jgi:putative flippase GtrA
MFWFAVVGLIGFAVDAGILEGLVHGLGFSPFSSRGVSFLAAASTTWILNRRWTFRHAGAPSLGEWVAYVALMLGGALINLSVYSAVVWWLGSAHLELILALAAGTGAGMAINFLTARRLLHSSALKISPASERSASVCQTNLESAE